MNDEFQKKNQIDRNLNFKNFRITQKKNKREKKFRNIFISDLKNLKKKSIQKFLRERSSTKTKSRFVFFL